MACPPCISPGQSKNFFCSSFWKIRREGEDIIKESSCRLKFGGRRSKLDVRSSPLPLVSRFEVIPLIVAATIALASESSLRSALTRIAVVGLLYYKWFGAEGN